MSATDSFITIDGAQGEGGGQILRTSLALSALCGKPIAIENIRAKRNKPGLLRQHLTGFLAIATITDAKVTGAELGAKRLTMRPGAVKPGDYHFAVSTAGSACLVFQTVLWPLAFANGPSRVVFEGGTHNSKSPPFDFVLRTFLPLMQRMGLHVNARLKQHGFYPAGGGSFEVEIEPVTQLEPLELLEGGEVIGRSARALVANLPTSIALRELATVRSRLGWAEEECRPERVESRGPGNVLMLHLEREQLTETFTAFGERGVAAERVAERAVDELEAHLTSQAPVGEHLSDQLLIPLALAGGGAFCAVTPSLHTLTNIEVIDQLLGKRARITQQSANCHRIAY